jgi:hypothetical protein
VEEARYFYIFAILTRGVAGLVPLSVTHVAPHVSDTCFGVLRKDGKYVNAPGSAARPPDCEEGRGGDLFRGARSCGN